MLDQGVGSSDFGGIVAVLGGVRLPRVWSALLFPNALFTVRVKKHVLFWLHWDLCSVFEQIMRCKDAKRNCLGSIGSIAWCVQFPQHVSWTSQFYYVFLKSGFSLTSFLPLSASMCVISLS